MIIYRSRFSHPSFSRFASVDTDSGEFQEKRLAHCEEAEKFYRAVTASGQKVRLGMEAVGHARWFERLLAELWIGDAGRSAASKSAKQKLVVAEQAAYDPINSDGHWQAPKGPLSFLNLSCTRSSSADLGHRLSD